MTVDIGGKTLDLSAGVVAFRRRNAYVLVMKIRHGGSADEIISVLKGGGTIVTHGDIPGVYTTYEGFALRNVSIDSDGEEVRATLEKDVTVTA